MIKYNNNTIYNWNFDTSNVIKVYRNNAIVFYKVSGESPTPEYKVCYAVVDDITQYTDREFEDVYDNATDKWYKLNNLNQYEEYGVYGSGRSITYYKGKLTIDDASSSRLPQGYTEVEYIENTGTSYINTVLQIYSSTTDSFEIESKLIAATHDSQSYQNVFSCMNEDGEPYQGFTYRYEFSSLTGRSIPDGQNTFTIVNNEDSTQTVTVTSSSSQRTYTHTYPLTLFCGLNSSGNPFRWTNSKFYYFKVKMNDELVRDFVPCKRDSDDKYGMFDLVNDVFYTSPNNVNFVGGEPVIEPIKTYEYEWNGSEWINLGEVSGSSRVPSEYVELTYAQTSRVESSYSNAFTVPIDLQETNNYIYEFTPLNWEESYYGHILGGNDGSTNFPKWGIFKLDNGWGDETKRFVSAFWNYNLESRSSSPGGNYRVYDNVKSKFTMNLHNYTVGQGADIKVENEGYETVTHTSTTIFKSGYSVTSGIYNIDVFSTSDGNSAYIASEQFHNLKVETNEGVAVYDYVPCKRNSDNKVGLYDVVNNAFYSPSAFTLTAGEEESHTTYPKYYTEKSEPLNNLTFNTMAEAVSYAKTNCVYDGMRAAIDGDRYIFSGDSQSGYEWVYNPSRLPVGYTEVEYIENATPNKAYIDTGFKPNQKTKTIADFQYVATNTHPRCFGCGPWNGLAYELNAENGIASNGVWNWKFGNTSSWLTTGVHTDFNRHTAIIDSGKLYLDGTVIGSTTVTTFQLTDNIGLFGFIENGSQGGTSSGEYMFGKFYSFQIYDDGTLVRDLVPCISPNDVVGMYDVVNDVFYSSANSYNFVSGPEVA